MLRSIVPFVGFYVLEELALLDILHHKIELARRLDDLVNADYVGVLHLLEDADFLEDSFDLAGFIKALFLENFDGNLYIDWTLRFIP